MSKIRTVQLAAPGQAFEHVIVEQPEPGPGEVRIRVEACGVCHSDVLAVHGGMPRMTYPVIPGHEIAGRIDALGEGVQRWQIDDRVGVGWFGGSCGTCTPCRDGDRMSCPRLLVPGVTAPGGYADALVVPADALAAIPAKLSAVDAAPLMCAGVTTFTALRNSCARPGDLVAVLGIGGLGHLGLQYAARFGFETVAIARGIDKRALALELGASHYIDSTYDDVARSLLALGGATVVLATAADSAAVSAAMDGIAPRGELVVVGAPQQPLDITPHQLIQGGRRVVGSAAGTSRDSERCLAFSARTGVRPMVEAVPLEHAAAAYQRMLSGATRFRMVLTTGG